MNVLKVKLLQMKAVWLMFIFHFNMKLFDSIVKNEMLHFIRTGSNGII